MQVIPKSNKAQGACSLDDRSQIFPVINILELLYGSLLNIKSLILFPLLSYLNSKNKFLPNPVLLIVFKNCFGIIISVSIFTIGRCAGIPFIKVNFAFNFDTF